MRKVIINSTPLIALCKVKKLGLLHDLYGEVTIPDAVFHEVSRKNDRVKKEIEESPWIHIESVTDQSHKRMYKAKLHDGEVEVMILAQEHAGDHLVVIDDYAARKTAEFLGLNLTGTIGVLIKAKQLGLLTEVMPIIRDLELNGIYFSDALKDRCRRIAEE